MFKGIRWKSGGDMRFNTSYFLSLFATIMVTFGILNNSCQALTAEEQKNFVQNLEASGITFNQSGTNLDITIDQVKALNTIPKLKTLGYLSEKVTQEVVNQKPTELAFMIGTIFTTVLIPYIYETNSSTDKLHITGYMLSPKDGKQPCFSLDFNRALYNKIDWNKFSDADLMKTAPNYTIVDWCHTKISNEMKTK